MKLLLIAVIAVAAFQVASGTPVAKIEPKNSPLSKDGKAVIEDGNEFVDAILAALRDQAILYGLDPMALPDELNGFSVTFLFIRYHGELWFYNGWLQNLSTIYRAGDAQVSQVDNILRIQTFVRFDRLFMTYQYLAKIMNVGPKGDVIGYVDDLIISIDLLVDMDTCDSTLASLVIADAGKLEVHLDGTWFFDVIWNAMLDMFTWMFKNTILRVIETKLRQSVEQTLPNIDFGTVTGVPCGPQRAIPIEKIFMH